MANRYGRPTVSRARQRAVKKKQDILILGGLAALLVVIVLAVILLTGRDRPDPEARPAVTDSTQAAALDPEEASVEAEEDQQETEPVTAEATAQPVQSVDPARAQSRPGPAASGFLPVFTRANTQEKIVAITVDDCFQADNLRQIVDAAIQVGGKLTIFPIGENVLLKKQSEILKYAWENGFELENHTFTHNGLFAVSDEGLAEEVYKQQLALSQILGVEYQCHFLRPRGGDARHDQRMHMYAKQLGYYGIAHWSASGSAGKSKIAKGLQPGAIYQFHTTDKDLEKLLQFIPWVVEQGYQLVTLNEMFGYPANETAPLTTPIDQHVIPPLQPYDIVYVSLKDTTYSWEAYLLQEKLIAMGYIEGVPDGVYVAGCAQAVSAYQRDHGLQETGVADADLVKAILEGEGT